MNEASDAGKKLNVAADPVLRDVLEKKPDDGKYRPQALVIYTQCSTETDLREKKWK